jgi:hypothetical protein
LGNNVQTLSEEELTMRRSLLMVPVVGLAALAAVFAFKPSVSTADPEKGGKSDEVAKAEAPRLPIAQAVLFSSGVGYFQREGQVEGDTRIDLSFQVQDINDLLKSMVLQDMNGGRISAVSYESRDPVAKTLRSFAINLTQNPGFGQILNQARGEKVEVTSQATGAAQPANLTGTIMGVEKKQQQINKDAVVELEMLNLWCTEGMRGVKLSEVQRVRFLNSVMENEVRRALEVLSQSHDTQKKAVSLGFSGKGKRQVKVSYVVENPIWKTSYRLVLDKEGKPFLQGWAVVENPSDEDWTGVRMALVSGRPISFQMDLYEPLYVPRPVVEPELFASLRPPTYSGDMRGGEQAPVDGEAAKDKDKHDRKNDAAEEESKAIKKLDKGKKQKEMREVWGKLPERERIDLAGRGVGSVATASNLGDFFQYRIEHPVTLPRQKSAMLPIVNKNVEGSKVSIYNERTLAKHPLLGLRLKNTTDMHLMQGPITVFDKDTYAGDARILDLQKGEERLISYAIDLGNEVEPVAKRDPDRFTQVKIVKGILQTTTKVREIKTYNLKNRSDQDRVVLIEHPNRADFKLVGKVEPKEKASDVYRFEVKVAAGKTASQEVAEERDILSRTIISNLDDDTIKLVYASSETNPKVITAIKKSQDLKGKISETARELALAQQKLTDLERDQTRIRANLKETPEGAAAYKKYLNKLDAQEGEIDKLNARIKELREAESTQRKEYDRYLANLTIE